MKDISDRESRKSMLSNDPHSHLTSDEVRQAAVIQSEILYFSQVFLRQSGFVQILPTIISPMTDPLSNGVERTRISCYGNTYSLTQSMIFHKQLALNAHDRVFVVSPNVRLEREDKVHTGAHLFEFVQIDLEIRNGTRDDVMALIEELLVYLNHAMLESARCGFIRERLSKESLAGPFPRMTHAEAVREFGHEFESPLSLSLDSPVWLVDIPVSEREFYDFQRDGTAVLEDMDLILPKGHGEVLSGGEREHEYGRIVKRMTDKKVSFEEMSWYLKLASEGYLPPSAGCGFGVERLTKYFCDSDDISLTRLFPKIPGRHCL